MAPPLSKGNRISSGGAKRARFTCIPDELVGEILLRVPIKSVIRFKSVCKAWLCLLNSRGFIRSYGRRESRFEFKLSSLHCGGTRKADLYKLAPRLRIPTTGTGTRSDDCIFLQVLGPLSNGIYCITSRAYHKPSGAFSVLTAQIALCNPATYALKFANPFPPEFHELLSTAETKGCNIHFGFGIGNGGDSDYRVVVLLNYGEGGASFLSFVYGVQRGEWRQIVDYEEGMRNLGLKKATDAFNGAQGRRMIEITPCMEACSQRLLHGCWHWVAIASEDVLSFNFADEAFRVIRGPPPPDIMADIGGRERIIQLCAPLVLRDRLAVIRSFRTIAPMTVEIDVWVMMEYGVQASWTRIYKTNPNVSIKLWRLCGMVHHQEQTGPGIGIRIQRLFFKTTNLDIISFDDAAGYTFHNLPSTSKIVHWNMPGVSSYIETLEHL